MPPGPAPEVRFQDVALTYPSRSGPALAGVDLTLRPGSTLLVTGRSGAGKTSLLSLLLRFAEPTAGRIVVSGADGEAVDLRDVAADEWRRRIAWVPQRPYLFDASVADNIRLGAPAASDAAVRRAARLAEAAELIDALPDGYATRLGERGSRLSAGQRQRIALARAFLRQEAVLGGQGEAPSAPIVLLDEPTAHLDPENAAAVRAGVARLLRGSTGVIVAHDEGWAGLADEVVHLDHGRVTVPVGPGR
jgi:ATP-binding cassette subfamily C protein CydD